VAQHIAPEFAAGMAAWLQRATGHPCVLALPGACLQAGTVHLSGRAGHLLVEGRTRFAYSAQPADCLYQPSINRLFTSVATGGPSGAAVLLSGMGSDGAEGLRALRSAGWRTFVQAPPSCVIDSMPRAALALHAAEQSLPPRALAAALQAEMCRTGVTHVPTA
jgi:two-component system response regulator WspF